MHYCDNYVYLYYTYKKIVLLYINEKNNVTNIKK